MSEGNALLSPCGRYRYELSRDLGSGEGQMIFIMLNPSTADASIDDPTVRRCMGFARREGRRHLRVVNLFPWRATDPRELETVVAQGGAIAVTGGQAHPLEHFRPGRDDLVVAAWGATVDRPTLKGIARAQVASMRGVRLLCLGKTKAGHPRHPLYVKADEPLVTWREVNRG